MKIALVPFNPIVGDIYGNIIKIRTFVSDAAARGVDVIVFPELALCGYPPRDLLDKPSFVSDMHNALQLIAPLSSTIDIIVGCVEKVMVADKQHLYNCAAYLHGGTIDVIARKSLLPTYDVFDEHRYFIPSDDVTVVTIGNARFGLSICEDLWFETMQKYTEDPIEKLKNMGIDYLINISASPFEEGKVKTRFKLIQSVAQRCQVPLLYVNQLGGNDGIVFDGGAIVVDKSGKVLAEEKRFSESVLIFDTGAQSQSYDFSLPDSDDDLLNALTLGVRDYTRKTGFETVLIGLSGGIDSALTAAIAQRALGSAHVKGVSMPSRFSSPGSIADAEHLAENLGIELFHVPIEPIFESYLTSLTPHFRHPEWDITEENIQARIRGGILMALSNKHHWLLLTTGNKSELAVGYCTMYGDMCGGLAVIGDVFKTRAYQISRAINRDSELIPESSITKPPSAELRHDQTDQDTLPDYDILDGILERYIEDFRSVDDIVCDGFERETVLRVVQMVDRTEYKRRQAALALKVSTKAFGEGRRIPIVQHYVPLEHCDLDAL